MEESVGISIRRSVRDKLWALREVESLQLSQLVPAAVDLYISQLPPEKRRKYEAELKQIQSKRRS